MSRPPTNRGALMTYEDVEVLFRAANLPNSRRSVTRWLRQHAHRCPPIRVSYKTVRFDSRKIDALVEWLVKPRRGLAMRPRRKGAAPTQDSRLV